jgi:hypothetical protein
MSYSLFNDELEQDTREMNVGRGRPSLLNESNIYLYEDIVEGMFDFSKVKIR